MRERVTRPANSRTTWIKKDIPRGFPQYSRSKLQPISRAVYQRVDLFLTIPNSFILKLVSGQGKSGRGLSKHHPTNHGKHDQDSDNTHNNSL
jgi:hypothetical protein